MGVRDRLDATLPPVLYGIRTAAAVCIALGLAFALELDQAYWAGTTAALVCQPVLGSALRKAVFRTFGTLAGAGAAMLLFACFQQDRVGFTLGFAGWCAMCGFVGSQLTLFAAYGAMLAGYTAAIIAGDVVSNPDQTFDVARRASPRSSSASPSPRLFSRRRSSAAAGRAWPRRCKRWPSMRWPACWPPWNRTRGGRRSLRKHLPCWRSWRRWTKPSTRRWARLPTGGSASGPFAPRRTGCSPASPRRCTCGRAGSLGWSRGPSGTAFGACCPATAGPCGGHVSADLGFGLPCRGTGAPGAA